MRILLTPLALLAGCVTSQTSDRPVALGETQRVGGLSVTPLAVVEDSRCPENARCVWAGRVIVRARIGGTERNLTLGVPAEVDGRVVMLDGVTPGRTAGTVASVAPYRFHFAVVEAGSIPR